MLIKGFRGLQKEQFGGGGKTESVKIFKKSKTLPVFITVCLVWLLFVLRKCSCVFMCLHRSAIFSLLLVTDNVVATGDDEGTLKVLSASQSLISSFYPNCSFTTKINVLFVDISLSCLSRSFTCRPLAL